MWLWGVAVDRPPPKERSRVTVTIWCTAWWDRADTPAVIIRMWRNLTVLSKLKARPSNTNSNSSSSNSRIRTALAVSAPTASNGRSTSKQAPQERETRRVRHPALVPPEDRRWATSKKYWNFWFLHPLYFRLFSLYFHRRLITKIGDPILIWIK